MPSRRERGRFSKQITKSWSDGSTYRTKGEVTVAESLRRLQGELERLGARLPVISSNLETRLGGLPRSNQRMPLDPGVAVYFQLEGKPIVLACDQYDSVAANLAAIAAHIDALRAIERHGDGSLEQMFSGFAALPSALAINDWRTILDNPTSLAHAESTFRERMKTAHPDVGGDEVEAARLNAAIAFAREVLTA